MNRKVIGMMILGILLVGGVSAGLVGWLSNTITADVSVSGPVFYLDGPIEGVYHNLYVNEVPEEEEIYFWDGHRIVFKTSDLEVDDFYKARFEVTIYMKTNVSGSLIQARIIKLKDNNLDNVICDVEEPIELTSTSNFISENFYCESEDTIELGEYESIGLELRGTGGEEDYYWISVGDESRTYGASRIEVSAA